MNDKIFYSRKFLPIVCFFLIQTGALSQQRRATEKIVISFPDMPLPVILGEYEQLTGLRIVRDGAVLGSTLSIETQQELTVDEAAEFIEKSLLLNGFALVPNGEDTLKIVAFSGGKQPISEGVPVITRREQLPESDVILTYLHPLQYMDPTVAQQELSEIFTMHSYGKVVILNSASALSITENAFTILKMLEVLDRIDLPPTETVHRSICLIRADPEEVVEAITDLMGLEQSGGENGQPSGSTFRSSSRRYLQSLPQETDVAPRIRAIPNSNRILMVGKPQDLKYIETLVSYFDEPVERKKMVRRKLNYLSVSALLPIAHHTLLRNLSSEDSANIAGGETLDQATVSTGGVGNAGAGSGSSQEVQELGPQSIIVGKTLLIADNIQNTLLVSGSANDIATLDDLIASMDLKPRQIMISAIIAQLTLGKDFEYGLDFVRTLGESNTAGVFRNRTGSILNPDTLTDFDNLLPAANGLTVYGQVNPALDAFLSTIENHNRFKVLSRPMVFTLNNRRAEILSGQRIAVPRTQQSSVNPNQVGGQIVTASIDFEEVLLRIEVLPLINEEDRITLQIAQTNEDIVGTQTIGGDEIPTIGTQALQTTVIVENGGTILLGGLISEEESKSKSGAPIMVNIPLVGEIFGRSRTDKERQELMIFIQPRIVDNDTDLSQQQSDLYERSQFLDESMEFAKPASEARARPVQPPKKRGLFQRLLKLDKID